MESQNGLGWDDLKDHLFLPLLCPGIQGQRLNKQFGSVFFCPFHCPLCFVQGGLGFLE